MFRYESLVKIGAAVIANPSCQINLPEVPLIKMSYRPAGRFGTVKLRELSDCAENEIGDPCTTTLVTDDSRVPVITRLAPSPVMPVTVIDGTAGTTRGSM